MNDNPNPFGYQPIQPSTHHDPIVNPNSLDSVIARMAVQIDQVNDKLTLLTATMRTRCDQLEARLETLETQKAWVVGVTTGVSIVMGLIWTLANKLWK